MSEEKDTEQETPETPPENTEDKSKDLQSALAQKEHFREKFDTSQEELKELKEKLQSLTKEKEGSKEETPKSEISATTNPMELVRLNKALEGYSEDEVEFIIKNAPTKDIDGIVGATKNEWVKTAINAMRDKVEKEKKVPSPTSRAPKIGDKTVADMSDTEKRDNFAELVRQAVSKGRGRTSRNI